MVWAAIWADDAVIFQHDNTPLRTSRLTIVVLQERNLKVLKWPARSLDLNPIENMWGLLAPRYTPMGSNIPVFRD